MSEYAKKYGQVADEYSLNPGAKQSFPVLRAVAQKIGNGWLVDDVEGTPMFYATLAEAAEAIKNNIIAMGIAQE